MSERLNGHTREVLVDQAVSEVLQTIVDGLNGPKPNSSRPQWVVLEEIPGKPWEVAQIEWVGEDLGVPKPMEVIQLQKKNNK